MKRKLEDSLRCLALKFGSRNPSMAIAARIFAIDGCQEGDFIRRADVILRAIGAIDPETKRSHYKQFGDEYTDCLPPEILAAIALRILNRNCERLFGVCVEQIASDMATLDKKAD
jgi:hypothetical protein